MNKPNMMDLFAVGHEDLSEDRKGRLQSTSIGSNDLTEGGLDNMLSEEEKKEIRNRAIEEGRIKEREELQTVIGYHNQAYSVDEISSITGYSAEKIQDIIDFYSSLIYRPYTG